MNPSRTHVAGFRRALTLVELLIALIITALMGLAIGSMMTMVSSVSERDRTDRAALLRTHAGQVRLRAYMDSALCVLQHDENNDAAVIWLYDMSAEGLVNLTEMRLISVQNGELTVEWVKFPENWSEFQQAAADETIPAGADFADAIATQRELGYTRTTTLLNDVADAAWTFSAKTAQESSRMRLGLTLQAGDNALGALYAFGLKDHTQPE